MGERSTRCALAGISATLLALLLTAAPATAETATPQAAGVLDAAQTRTATAEAGDAAAWADAPEAAETSAASATTAGPANVAALEALAAWGETVAPDLARFAATARDRAAADPETATAASLAALNAPASWAETVVPDLATPAAANLTPLDPPASWASAPLTDPGADSPGALPARPASPVPWHLAAVDAPAAWNRSTGAGVVVAVIDSGVDADHPDLAGAVLPGRSYVDVDPGDTPRLLAVEAEPSPVYERAFGQSDPVGHGTAVAGLIAGRTASGHPGIAPDAEILPVRVLDDENRYHDSAMVGAAVEWAVDNGADVINLSLGGQTDSAPFAEALAYAERHDVIVVACTGNHHEDGGGEEVWFPARLPDVLAVTGTDDAGRRWPTAVTGEGTDLAAPGAELLAPAPGGGHKTVTGTSFASAIVAGAAALVRSAHPDWSAAQVRAALTSTAAHAGSGLGAGLVDAAAAIAADPAEAPVEAATEVTGAWSLAATAAGGGLIGMSALLLRGGRRSRGRVRARSGPRTIAG
ncbi:S8 family serine peptidase [Glycomyces sp. NPDC046736]|uniref:S8 family serine peptidase n=1 Tax=Glycomyces sp. NPDC046736 TaxID=3155615 RepID=UPI00340AF8A5